MLTIDGYIRWTTLRVCETGISTSGTTIFIPAKLTDLKLKLADPSKEVQHFNIELIQCNLSLLGNTKKLEAKNIFNPYSSKNPNHDQDITFEFPLSRSDMEEIENKRRGSDVNLGLYVNFHLEILPHPSTKIEGKRISPAHLNLKIFRSQWEETILPAFGYSKEYIQNEPEKRKESQYYPKQ
mgnify:CR=1 FL=1